MSTPATVTTDEFQALEQKVLRAVEVVRREREARAVAESEAGRLREEVERLRTEHAASTQAATTELDALRGERAEVRQRVEAMLSQMDELL